MAELLASSKSLGKVTFIVVWIVLVLSALLLYSEMPPYIYYPMMILAAVANYIFYSLIKRRPQTKLDHPIFWIFYFIYLTVVSAAIYYTGGLKSPFFLLYFLLSVFLAATLNPTKLFWFLSLIALQYVAITYNQWRHSLASVKILSEQVIFLFLISYFVAAIYNRVTSQAAELKKTKEDFVSIVSHELRAPLTSIIGYISLILSGKVGKVNSRQKAFLEPALVQAEQLGKIISGLLDLSHPGIIVEETGVTKFNLADLIKSTAEKFKIAAGKTGLSLEVDLPSSKVPIQGNSHKIERVLNNLVENALKFAQTGSITLKLRKKADNVLVQVVDSGSGIAQEHLPHIFEKFYQVDSSSTRDQGGSGLGLAICKDIIEALGGKIWVVSEAGKGSIFSFTLPTRRKGERKDDGNKSAVS